MLSEHSVRRSPRLSQRFSQPPETTSSHPLVESRRSLRSTVSVEPRDILNESGQTVPPSFYGDGLEQHTRKATAGEHLHSYVSQRGLPEHLYGTHILLLSWSHQSWSVLYNYRAVGIITSSKNCFPCTRDIAMIAWLVVYNEIGQSFHQAPNLKC